MSHTLCINRIVYIHGIRLVMSILLGRFVFRQPCYLIVFKALGEVNKRLSTEL